MRLGNVCGALRAVTVLSTLLSTAACGDGEQGVTDSGAGGGSTHGNTSSSTSSGSSSVCQPSELSCEGYASELPFRLGEHTAVSLPDSGEMVVFGGSHALPTATCDAGPTDYSNETWIYSEACDAWKQATAAGPSRRARHVAAYGSGKMWVFGGRSRDQAADSGDYTVYDDLWAFDVASGTWNEIAVEGEAPEARHGAAMVWDSARNRLWLFGGNTATGGMSYALLDDVWSYEPETNVWSEAGTTGDVPVRRQWHGMVYDASRDRLVVHGGGDPTFGYLTDTTALDLDTLTWERLDEGGGAAPSERFWGSLVYREQQRDYLWFGGHDNTNLGNRNDLYRFDPETNLWERLFEGDTFNQPGNALCDFPPDFATIDASLPERRHATSWVWSSACERVLLFGGKTDCGIVDDLWSYAGDGWQKLQRATEGEVCYRWRDDPDRCTSLCQ